MPETIALIDYGAGNLRSVANALKAAGADGVAITADPAIVATADRIGLPGVGAFGNCIAALRAIPGLIAAMERRVKDDAVPFLGICVGMQLLADKGEEHGVHKGLGWIGGTVRAMQPADPDARVPHMGWNGVFVSASPIASDSAGFVGASPAVNGGALIERGEAYFLHSYHLADCPAASIAATTDHGGAVVAAVARDTIIGVQFHPEKSQRYGIAFLERFLAWRP